MKTMLGRFTILVMVFTILADTIKAQNHSTAMAVADTSRFSVNSRDGWQLYNSYVAVANQKHDSAILEATVQHGNNLDFKREQFIGKIKYGPLLPQRVQSIVIPLMFARYRLRIDIDGKCWLCMLQGPIITDNPVILPLKAQYKL